MSAARKAEPVQLSTRLALTIEEAAAALGVSERHLRALLPDIPHVRLGGRVVIPVGPFDEWLRKRVEQEAAAIDRVVDGILEKLAAEGDE